VQEEAGAKIAPDRNFARYDPVRRCSDEERLMRENLTLNADANWTAQAVRKLEQLWKAGVPVATIAATLGRPEAMVREKAVELKLGVHGG
jgi:hypothetical protein